MGYCIFFPVYRWTTDLPTCCHTKALTASATRAILWVKQQGWIDRMTPLRSPWGSWELQVFETCCLKFFQKNLHLSVLKPSGITQQINYGVFFGGGVAFFWGISVTRRSGWSKFLCYHVMLVGFLYLLRSFPLVDNFFFPSQIVAAWGWGKTGRGVFD